MRRCIFCSKRIWLWQKADKLGLGHNVCEYNAAIEGRFQYLSGLLNKEDDRKHCEEK